MENKTKVKTKKPKGIKKQNLEIVIKELTSQIVQKDTQILSLNASINKLEEKNKELGIRIEQLDFNNSQLEKEIPIHTQAVIDRSELETLEGKAKQAKALATTNEALQKRNDELIAKLELYEGLAGIFKIISDKLNKIFKKNN